MLFVFPLAPPAAALNVSWVGFLSHVANLEAQNLFFMLSVGYGLALDDVFRTRWSHNEAEGNNGFLQTCPSNHPGFHFQITTLLWSTLLSSSIYPERLLQF